MDTYLCLKIRLIEERKELQGFLWIFTFSVFMKKCLAYFLILKFVYILGRVLGEEPKSSRWTLMCLNMQYILSIYLNKQFSHLKSIRLCSNMFIKNVFTSSTLFQQGLDISKARKTGTVITIIVTMCYSLSLVLEVCLGL